MFATRKNHAACSERPFRDAHSAHRAHLARQEISNSESAANQNNNKQQEPERGLCPDAKPAGFFNAIVPGKPRDNSAGNEQPSEPNQLVGILRSTKRGLAEVKNHQKSNGATAAMADIKSD